MRLELRHQCDFTVLGETAGKIALRSAMCASPSLRIMLCPISLFIKPCGWCDENHVNLLFGNEDVVAAAQQRAAELRDERDRRDLRISGERRIGIAPESGGIDVEAGRRCSIRASHGFSGD